MTTCPKCYNFLPGHATGSGDWLADIERVINHAYESGYISGHNDTCEGCFNENTKFVAKDRAAEIVRVVKAHIAANQLGIWKEYAAFVDACNRAKLNVG